MAATAPWLMRGPIRVAIRLRRIADPDLAVCRRQGLRHLRRDAALQEHAAGGGAALPGRPHRAEDHRAHRQIEIRVVEDDDAVVAAQFEQRAAEPCSHDLRNMAPHRARAGEADEGQAAIAEHGFTHDFVGADHRLEHAAESMAVQHPTADPVDGEGAERCL